MRARQSVLICSLLIAPAGRALGQQPVAPSLPAASIVPPSARLAEISDDGRYARLDDGTLWEIISDDRVTASAWQQGQSIVLRRIPAPTGRFEYALVNAEADRTAAARFAGRPEARVSSSLR